MQQDAKYKGERNAPWVEVEEERAASKVGHCLREKIKDETTTTQEGEASTLKAVAPRVIPLTRSCSVPWTTSENIKPNVVPTLTPTSHQAGFASAKGDDSREEPTALLADLTANISTDQNLKGNGVQERTDLITNMSKNASIEVPSPSQYGKNEEIFRKPMPLRMWIKDALKTIKNSSSLSKSESNPILSKYFIIPSLEIALSLANQVCDAQEMTRASQKARGVRGYYSYLPTSIYDWADHVIVQFPSISNSDEEVLNLEPLALTSGNEMSLKHDECNAILSSIAHNAPFCGDWESVERKNEWTIDFDQDGLTTSCLRVDAAKLLPPISGKVRKGEAKHETQRIYMLGRVFYEIFSGGELPPKQEENKNADFAGNPQSPAIRINFQERLNLCDDDLSGSPCQGQQSKSETAMKDENENQGKKRRSYKCENIYDVSTFDPRYESEFSVSVESLKLTDLPLSICELINNMLNSARGDIVGNEAYCRMVDVQEDLRLMLDKPSTFLRNPDVEQISVCGLESNETVYGQREEFELLRTCYWKSSFRGDDFAIITGPSGSGKSVLARQFCNYIVEDGGTFLSGKFEQFQQATPFSAITNAFDEYCSMLVGSSESAHATKVASALRENLGRDAFYLIELIPTLSLIVGDINVEGTRGDFVDAQILLQNLLCRFLTIILISSAKPVILFLDDLQWADPLSITVVGRLLSANFPRFVFVGSCRDDEMGHDGPLWSMISDVQTLGLKAQIIQMRAFDEAAVNEMLSDMLRLSRRLTRPLANIIHHKTKGNPLFLNRLIMSLNKEGLLQFSLSRRRWEWDEEQIQSRKIPDDVAGFLTTLIAKLPENVQLAMFTLSCFGTSASSRVLEVLEMSLGIQLKNEFEVAASEGFLEKVGENYEFCHDRIHEAAYNILDARNQRLRHSQYGLTLCKHIIDYQCDDSMLFTAVDQVNRGDPTIIMYPEQGQWIAFLNLKAGKKAMEMAAFAFALTLFEQGMQSLHEEHWLNDYQLSLELFDCALKCSYAIGDHKKLHVFSEQVISSAKSFEDKLNATFYSFSSLCDASMFDEAIKKGMWVLSMLGEDLPFSTSYSHTLAIIAETRSILNSYSFETLINYKMMTDSIKTTTMKFLSRLIVSLVLTSADFAPIVTVKVVKLSLAHGMTPMSAIGFVYFGSMLASTGEIEEGYRFVKLAMNMVKRFGCKEVEGEVIVVATQTIIYKEPMQTAHELYAEGHVTALEAGDIRNASLNYALLTIHLLWSGANLNVVKNKAAEALRFMEQHSTLSILTCVTPILQTINNLIGSHELPLSPDTSIAAGPFLDGKHLYASITVDFQNMYISYMHRDFSATKKYTETYLEYKMQTWLLLNADWIRTFITSLASFWIYRRTYDDQWLEKGNELKAKMKLWTESSEWNFVQLFHLLEAEGHFSKRQHDEAKISYDRAIQFSKKHKFIHHQALSCELAGLFSLEIGQEAQSLGYFTQAQSHYKEWGATSKSKSIVEFIQSTFSHRS